MHYHAEVWIKESHDVEEQVELIMAPYDECLEVVQQPEPDGETYWINPDSFWDWWQIGGRWKGAHVPDYDANDDPTHQVICDLCNGTGDRPGWVHYGKEGERLFRDEWAEKCNGCNGCKGKGLRVSWPTQWPAHPQDVIAVADVPDTLNCYTLIVNGNVYHTKEWSGETFEETAFDGRVKPFLENLGITDGYLVTVDYHS